MRAAGIFDGRTGFLKGAARVSYPTLMFSVFDTRAVKVVQHSSLGKAGSLYIPIWWSPSKMIGILAQRTVRLVCIMYNNILQYKKNSKIDIVHACKRVNFLIITFLVREVNINS